MAVLDRTRPPDSGVVVRDLTLAYGSTVVQHELSFHVRPASIFVIMGVSGCGKSTLLRHMIDLEQAAQGDITFDGQRLWTENVAERRALQRRIGVLFQSTALWSSMTVGENVGLPLQLHTRLSAAEIRDQVAFKLALVGLAGQESRMPSELSGGMQKRAGLARAIALDPDYLFLRAQRGPRPDHVAAAGFADHESARRAAAERDRRDPRAAEHLHDCRRQHLSRQ